jgi:hypothetical protein
VKAIVKAANINGFGPFSQANTSGALVEYPPIQMTAPTSGLNTNEQQIEVDWTALTGSATGGATITSYNLQYDSGSNGVSWSDVVGAIPTFTGLSTVLSSQIAPGVTYQFKVRAANVHGYGAFSSIVSIKAAQTPSKMSSPVTSVDSVTGKLQISWNAPHDGSQTISSYLIEIADSMTSSWNQDSTNCPGSDPSSLSCLVPMNVLTAAPYNYVFE